MIAIDRFRAKGLSPADEATAQDIARSLGRGPLALLFGYLESSIAIALEKPRWASRRRLAIDLRAVEIAQRGLEPVLDFYPRRDHEIARNTERIAVALERLEGKTQKRRPRVILCRHPELHPDDVKAEVGC